MKQVIQEILQYVIDHPEMTSIAAVDSFFDQFLFLLEKQEWDLLSEDGKREFIKRLNDSKGRPPKGPGRR